MKKKTKRKISKKNVIEGLECVLSDIREQVHSLETYEELADWDVRDLDNWQSMEKCVLYALKELKR